MPGASLASLAVASLVVLAGASLAADRPVLVATASDRTRGVTQRPGEADASEDGAERAGSVSPSRGLPTRVDGSGRRRFSVVWLCPQPLSQREYIRIQAALISS